MRRSKPLPSNCVMALTSEGVMHDTVVWHDSIAVGLLRALAEVTH